MPKSIISYKRVINGQTLTRLRLLQGEERIAELARMLGESITDITWNTPGKC